MMTREDKVKISIQKAIEAGYVYLCEGNGSYDYDLHSYRSQGYDVKGWYTSYSKDSMSYIMYGKKKVQRVSKKIISEQKPKYTEMNVKTLRKICSEKKIAGYSKMNKQQIIEVLAAC